MHFCSSFKTNRELNTQHKKSTCFAVKQSHYNIFLDGDEWHIWIEHVHETRLLNCIRNSNFRLKNCVFEEKKPQKQVHTQKTCQIEKVGEKVGECFRPWYSHILFADKGLSKRIGFGNKVHSVFKLHEQFDIFFKSDIILI